MLGEPLRHPRTGLCLPCKPGELGEYVAKVVEGDRGGPDNFQAYVGSKEETKKKVLRDVWKKGDVIFRYYTRGLESFIIYDLREKKEGEDELLFAFAFAVTTTPVRGRKQKTEEACSRYFRSAKPGASRAEEK